MPYDAQFQLMTSAEIRQSYLDFFREKQHTIVPSSSLLPDAPNLLFTNSGMNQFVPIFLGQQTPSWKPARTADTQKCIRAGGKHNDLEDVGFDTYHQTFFEMLGNWSFGDYFKKEAIAWAWELVVGRWKFPANRVYATVYKPGPGDPASFDQEAYDYWAEVFTAAGLDPKVHIVYGNKKDNFWMMGDTGPCGPCSELHIDLTPEGDTKGKLVNVGDARCIEIWNLVFIQFNATPDGKYEPLPAKHVDTGMGFERVTSMIQGTKNFTDFRNARISNYETDVFRPIFDAIEKVSGQKYGSTLPIDVTNAAAFSAQEKIDVAFRVIADHIRTLSFAIADGIIPSNEGRGYVLRRILRRAVKYGRELGLREPFLAKLVPVLVDTMSGIFPEIKTRQAEVKRVLTSEEESFLNTLERGIELFHEEVSKSKSSPFSLHKQEVGHSVNAISPNTGQKFITGDVAFKLYDTYGFPLDLTQLMARELGLSVEIGKFELLMGQQRQRSQAAQKKEVISLADDKFSDLPGTKFVGYETLEVATHVRSMGNDIVVFDQTPFYPAMGGQVSDAGNIVKKDGSKVPVKALDRFPNGVIIHITEGKFELGDPVTLIVDQTARSRIQSHHSGTHIMHWALRKVLGTHVGQKGSYVGPDRLRFDFTHGEQVKAEQLVEINRLVNEHIDAKEKVSWENRPYAQVKGDPNILQFFGDKYGDEVRVVSIGDYSKELCGGTHVRNTSEIGFFQIVSESAIAAGVRRIEAVCGEAIVDYLMNVDPHKVTERSTALQKKLKELGLQSRTISHPTEAGPPMSLSERFGVPLETIILDRPEPSKGAAGYWEAYIKLDKTLKEGEIQLRELEKTKSKEREAQWQSQAAAQAGDLIGAAKNKNNIPYIAVKIEAESGYLPVLADAIKNRWKGVLVLGAAHEGKVSLLAAVSPDFTNKIQAGKIIQAIAPIVGGKGGGKPELAQGGGTQPEKLGEALAKVETLL